MLRIGLTGGIGAGKSTVARRLAELGAVVLDADAIAREVVEPGSEGLAAVVAAFGPGVLAADGTLDRPALGRSVFADGAARERLNAVLHPRIARRTAELADRAGAEAIVVHDVPLLVENAMGDRYHLVVVVDVPADVRIERLVRDRGMTRDDARARVAAQASDAERRAAADVLLDNTGPRHLLEERVEALWRERCLPFAAALRAGRGADAVTCRGRGAGDDAATARVAARLRRALAGVDGVTVTPGDGMVTVAASADDAAAVRAGLGAAGYFPVNGGGSFGPADPGGAVGVSTRA